VDNISLNNNLHCAKKKKKSSISEEYIYIYIYIYMNHAHSTWQEDLQTTFGRGREERKERVG